MLFTKKRVPLQPVAKTEKIENNIVLSYNMINRVLIRIKTLQILFACSQNKDQSLKAIENELLHSLQKSYDLYFYFLLLIVDITRIKQQKTDIARNKYLPTEEDLNPAVKLDENKFARQLAQNETLCKYVEEQKISWNNDLNIVRHLLNAILESDLYRTYLELGNSNYNADREFWRAAFKNIICTDEELDAQLEEMCIYWNDDLEIIETFVLKTIKRFEEENGEKQELLPMFKSDDDRDFAIELLRLSLSNGDEYKEMINAHLKNWDMDRIAEVDLLLLRMAIAEILSFPTIPISVTMNEYIEIAKAYSTPKSATFINGILDALVRKLKSEKKLLKS